MNVISPLTITDAMLNASSIPEPDTSGGDPAVWVSGGSYAPGDLVSRTTTHSIYVHLDVGGGAHAHTTPPEDDPEHWGYVRPTNRWAAFDSVVGTASTATGDGSSSLTFDIEPGQAVSSIAFFELDANSVQVQMFDGATLVYDQTVALDETELLDWYMYFFEPFATRQTLVLSELPPYVGGIITITIEGASTVSVGNIVLGLEYEIGKVGYGSATAGIRDYSKKLVDENTGYVTIEQRRFAKIMRVRFILDEDAVNFTHKLLTSLRSTPCVWIADNGAGLEPLIVYGFYKDFQLELEQRKISYYSIEIEGMV